MAETFWLSDAQWAAIEPLLPSFGGKPRVDDRRVISGIFHRFREGLRWRALLDVYGPRTTVFNRFNRWSERGLWQDLFTALAQCEEPPLIGMADSTAVRTHRAAAGGKGGLRCKPSDAPGAGEPPNCTPSLMVRAAHTP
jgi:transposase